MSDNLNTLRALLACLGIALGIAGCGLALTALSGADLLRRLRPFLEFAALMVLAITLGAAAAAIGVAISVGMDGVFAPISAPGAVR